MAFEAASEIERSLDIAAMRAGDINRAIYARLYAAFPETEPLFALDRDGGVRGAMMTHVFETIFDFIGERRVEGLRDDGKVREFWHGARIVARGGPC